MDKQEIIQSNLAMMLGTDPDQMGSLEESMGGNADSYQGATCIGANFLFEPDTGRIVHFGNLTKGKYFSRSTQKFIGEGYLDGTFRIAINFSDSVNHFSEYVVEIYGVRDCSEHTLTTIAESAYVYNEHNKSPLPRCKLSWTLLYLLDERRYNNYSYSEQVRKNWEAHRDPSITT